MTKASRDLSNITNTPQGFKSVTQLGGAADNFDAGSPSRLSIYIDEEAVVLEAKLRIEISAYRTWETDTASGGSSTPTSGASSASSSASGGSSTPTSSATGGHSHLIFEQNDPAVPSLDVTVAGYLARKSGGGNLKFNLDANSADVVDVYSRTAQSDHSHQLAISSHQHSIAHDHQVDIAPHAHAQTYEVVEVAGMPGALSFSVDGVDVSSIVGGPWSVTSLPATFEADLTSVLNVAGWHTLAVATASGRGRCVPYVILKSLQLN